MRLFCRIVVWGFAVLYALALLALAAGMFGWFGVEEDAFSGAYLIVLGLPWTRFLDLFPESSWPLVVALAPAVNLVMLSLLCRLFTWLFTRRASQG